MTQVFVGGTHDGERVEVYDTAQHWELLNQEDLEELKTRLRDQSPGLAKVRREHYRKFQMVAGEKVFSVFALEGIRPSYVLGMIIDGYKKGGE